MGNFVGRSSTMEHESVIVQKEDKPIKRFILDNNFPPDHYKPLDAALKESINKMQRP